MPPYERDQKDQDKQLGSQPGPRRDAPAAPGSNTNAEDSAAHIADMVRRTARRHAGPDPTPAAHVEATVVQPQVPAPDAAAVEPQRPAPDATALQPQVPAADATVVQPRVPAPDPAFTPLALPAPQQAPRLIAPARRQPSLRVLVAGAAVVAVLIAGAFALSRPASSEAGSTSPTPAAAPASPAPAGYAVQVTDVITDCANHSYGRTKRSFKARNCVTATRSLATGQVNGRQTLFVMSRIEMASVGAAASIKKILDSDGTGNLNDLLREGKSFAGAPGKMPSSGYASVQTGKVIVVTEAGFADGGPSSNTTPALRTAAAQVAGLDTATG
jgi:hypothetical protein